MFFFQFLGFLCCKQRLEILIWGGEGLLVVSLIRFRRRRLERDTLSVGLCSIAFLNQTKNEAFFFHDAYRCPQSAIELAGMHQAGGRRAGPKATGQISSWQADAACRGDWTNFRPDLVEAVPASTQEKAWGSGKWGAIRAAKLQPQRQQMRRILKYKLAQWITDAGCVAAVDIEAFIVVEVNYEWFFWNRGYFTKH